MLFYPRLQTRKVYFRMVLIKTYLPQTVFPVWSLYNEDENTLICYEQHKHLATSVLNKHTGRNLKPQQYEYTFYEYLIADPDKAAVYPSDTFQFSGTITDEQRRYFHLVREPALRGYHDWQTLQELAHEHHITLNTHNPEDTLLEYSFVYTWLELANRPTNGMRKKMYPIHQIADYISSWTRTHFEDGNDLHIPHPEHDLITLAAIELSIENTGDRYISTLNHVQNQRRKNILKLPRKLYGDCLNYCNIHDPKRAKRRFRNTDNKMMLQPPLESLKFSDILDKLPYSDARELEHMARMKLYSQTPISQE